MALPAMGAQFYDDDSIVRTRKTITPGLNPVCRFSEIHSYTLTQTVHTMPSSEVENRATFYMVSLRLLPMRAQCNVGQAFTACATGSDIRA